MKKLFAIFTFIAMMSVVFASCSKNKGYCHCYSSSPYVDYSQMNAQAAAITTEEGCEQYNHGSAGYFHCSWIRE